MNGLRDGALFLLTLLVGVTCCSTVMACCCVGTLYMLVGLQEIISAGDPGDLGRALTGLLGAGLAATRMSG